MLALATSSGAHAQTTAKAAPVADTAPEIVVTGTRIKGAANAVAASPISVTTSAQIQLSKADSVEEVLSKMAGADFTGGYSSASNNGGQGLSEISLHNLGPTRALILIDGQRLIPVFSGTETVVDLNAVPLSMVDRVEVLRDGASSVYGADAIGGVVNIITKKNAEGMTADFFGGVSGHGDGTAWNFASSVGVNSDRANVNLAIGWDHRDAIGQSERNWAVNPHIGDPNNEGGSAYRSQLNIAQQESGDPYPDPTVDNPNNTSNHPAKVFVNGHTYSITDPTVNWSAIDPALTYLPNVGRVKMNAGNKNWNDLTGGTDRKQISFSGHYNLTDNVRFILEGFYTHRTSDQSLRPEPLLGDTIATFVPGTTTTLFQGFIIPADAPGNPNTPTYIPSSTSANGLMLNPIDPLTGLPTAQAFAAYLTPNQFGPRLYHQESNTYRIRTGFEGTVFGKYDWEAGYVYQENSTRADVKNEANFNHLAQITEQIACVDVPGGCTTNGAGMSVPITQPNYFGDPNKIFTAAQLKYLLFDNIDQNTTSESYAYGNISGPIWDLPAGTLKGSAGVEFRQERLQDTPSELVQEGWAPNASAVSGGSYHVESIFGELIVPLLKGLPGIESLTVTPSVRYDHYSNFGGAFTNKVGLDYKITQDVRIRGSFATGFRAPTTAELFGGHLVSDNGASGDPCDTRAANYQGNKNIGKGVLTAGSTCSLAVAGGAAVTNFTPSQDDSKGNQIQVLEGGNPNLKPEISESYGIGVVFTPRWTPGLSFSADYYSVRISNTILGQGIAGTASPDVVLNGCYGAAQNQAFCSLVTRNSSGVITQVNSLASNFGTEKVQGVDYQIDYDTAAAHLNLPIPGSFHFTWQMSNLLKHTTENPDGTSNSFAGTFQYSAESIQPRWKGTAAIDYHVGPWTAHWDLLYYAHMKSFDGGDSVYGNQIPDMYYNNISASYSFSDLAFLKKARITFGIDNVADQDPPFLNGDSTCKCNSLAGPFDFVGRFFYGRLSTSF
ncbi:MAG: TonB-dependent receptor [Caulobacteraceae bacterium]|nr:TonB-dependent receptor [Caulobacteraceae bacterium]